jgi:hypothetical protein
MSVISAPFITFSKKLYRICLKKFAQNNYYCAKALYISRLEEFFKKKSGPPIIIYQMGKVGSSSIKKTLDKLNLDNPIYHVHFLTKKLVLKSEKDRKPFFRTDKHHLLQRPWLNQFLIKKIENGLNEGKWKIITLTRDPVARNISAFFENLEVHVQKSNDKFTIESDIWGIEPTEVKLGDIHNLIAIFFDKFYHFDPMEFFDREIKGIFGTDVYSTEFPTSRGYKIYNDEMSEILLVRLENLNECAQKAFADFIGINNLVLSTQNVGSEKKYAPLYREFKKSIVFPKGYIDQMYDSKYMRHFYNQEEIKKFRSKWQIMKY